MCIRDRYQRRVHGGGKREVKYISEDLPAGPRFRTIKERNVNEPQKPTDEQQTKKKPVQKARAKAEAKQQPAPSNEFKDQRQSFGSVQRNTSLPMETEEHVRYTFGRQGPDSYVGKRQAEQDFDELYELQQFQTILQDEGVRSFGGQTLDNILEGVNEYQISSQVPLNQRFAEFDDYSDTEEYFKFQKEELSLGVKQDLKTGKKVVNLFSKHIPQLKDKLESIAAKYGKQLKEVLVDLEAVSGDFNTLIKCYEHPQLQGLRWLPIEDTILKEKEPSDFMFQMLVHNKGADSVKRRLKFLKVNKNIGK
eukprot:TRINITY_DN1914_c0_g1_i1.p1 TRINITY_DN1914_c0_g1~~TRINITY_DN1914_c0_g1_i1.p1  ORF type:complete len:307 (-),score=72.04 TRINITY_DN1914_c0_g1_i1:98-1018(-)